MHELEVLLLKQINLYSFLAHRQLSEIEKTIAEIQKANDLLKKLDPSTTERVSIDAQRPGSLNTVLMVAASFSGCEDILQLLIHSKAKLDLQNRKNKTALFHAAENDCKKNVGILLRAGANPDIGDEQGQTPLMSAVLKGREDIVEQLLEAGAAVELKDHLGRTAFDLAVECKNLKIAAILLEFGARIQHVSTFRGLLCLHTGPEWETQVSICQGISHRQMGEDEQAEAIYNKQVLNSKASRRLLEAFLLGRAFRNLEELVACRNQVKHEAESQTKPEIKPETRPRTVIKAVLRPGRLADNSALPMMSASKDLLFALPPVELLEEEKMVHGRKPKNPGMPGRKMG